MPTSKKHLAFARAAEDFVARDLQRTGWTILARNWRRRGCELDIVAGLAATARVIEVKARHQKPSSLADLEAILPQKKRETLVRGSTTFISEQTRTFDAIRIDLAIVHSNGNGFSIQYIENVLD